MTKEEAIRILSTRDKYGVPCGYTSGYQEALDMAIEALKEKKTKVICDNDDCKWIESGICQKDSIDLGKPVYVTRGCPNGEEDDDD